MTNEIQTLSRDTLSKIQGGNDKPWGNDVGSQVAHSIRSSFHSWRTRTGQAFTDVATRHPVRAVGNSLAATSDLAALPLKAAGTLGLAAFSR